jgi:hypothetical protein
MGEQEINGIHKDVDFAYDQITIRDGKGGKGSGDDAAGVAQGGAAGAPEGRQEAARGGPAGGL